jgi:CDP-diacylglycerol--glycerol-3-phosphate 3-phosphatidyltransferase
VTKGKTAAETMKKQIANLVTGCRMVCGIGMMFFPVFSSGFFAAYLLGGLTDMTDGTIARKMGAASDFGARLDSAADLIFVVCSAVKLLPVLELPGWILAWGLLILAIKLGNLVCGVTRKKGWMFPHTVLNKLTGFLLFLLPLTLWFIPLTCSAVIVCSVATTAAVQEGFVIRA